MAEEQIPRHPDTQESGPQLGLECHGRAHPGAASHLANTSPTAGAAAEAAATRKQTLYQELSNTRVFIPLDLETLGHINNTGIDFISDLGCDLTRSTGDPRGSSF